jgi:hypothetical protein
MKTPTLEQVKEHFKNAKEVKCLSSGYIHDLTKIEITRDIHEWEEDGFWIDANITGRNIQLHSTTKGFTEIISYKTEFTHLEEIEVAYDPNNWIKGKFVGKTSKGLFVVEDWQGGIRKYKYVRKIDESKNKAILEIREMMSLNNIKKQEL